MRATKSGTNQVHSKHVECKVGVSREIVNRKWENHEANQDGTIDSGVSPM